MHGNVFVLEMHRKDNYDSIIDVRNYKNDNLIIQINFFSFKLKVRVCEVTTYSPFCMDFNRIRQYLKSGLTSESSCQQSCIQRSTDSSHLAKVRSGR